jgi:hypothetical protein
MPDQGAVDRGCVPQFPQRYVRLVLSNEVVDAISTAALATAAGEAHHRQRYFESARDPLGIFEL